MSRNKLIDLNNHLFAALERLNDESLSAEQIESEAKRAESIIGISAQIISNAKTTIEAMKLVGSGHISTHDLPENFGLQSLNRP